MLTRKRKRRKSNPRALTRTNEGRALPVMGATPSMAEGTAGVESAGRAEKASAARPEALELRAMAGQRAGAKGRGRDGLERKRLREGTRPLETARERCEGGIAMTGSLRGKGILRQKSNKGNYEKRA